MAPTYVPNNARLAKNTILLYFRMILMLCINLYTSRVVLEALGIEDFGIYNVVGGIVVMLSIISESMTASTKRFLSYELGCGNKKRLHEVFITSVHIYVLISLVIVILGETVGLWFVMEKMVIPAERMTAALWCYQLSIFTAVVNVLYFPYVSAIVVHERMSSFAYIAILDAVLKLLLVYLLLIFDYDRLILYAVLYALEKMLIRSVYNIYCVRHFEECRYHWFFEKNLFKEMATFAGWKMWGNIALVGYVQGLDVLLNLFFGPVVNAARSTAYYVQGAVGNFSINFKKAMDPQIMKTYASGQINETHQLIYRATRWTFCLLLVICLPLFAETPTVLGLWLKEVPKGSATFLRLLLVILMVEQTTSALVTAIAATGNIKKYESVLGTFKLSILPVSYFVLRMGGSPWSVFVVYLIIDILAFFVTLHITLPPLGLRFMQYIMFAIKPCAMVLLSSMFVPIVVKMLLSPGLAAALINIVLTVFSTTALCFAFGFEAGERREAKRRVVKILAKVKKTNC